MWTQAVDTVFVVAPTPTRSVAADWALVVLGAAAAVGILVAIPLLFQLRNGLRSMRRTSRELGRKADPILERGKAVGANLEFITETLKHDVEALNGAIRSLSDRLTQASDHMEERISDFNALMEVVQGEAEGVFVETASTARGVRAGARHLAGKGRGRGERGGSEKAIGSGAPDGAESSDERGPAPDAGTSAPRIEEGAPAAPHGDPLARSGAPESG